jgi:HK97 family phage prohead protease
MKKQYEKLSEDIKAKMSEYFANLNIKEFIEKTKATTDESGTFEVVISTDNEDRQGEVIDQKGWDLSNYMVNPVVLWAHDYCTLPIGVAESVEQKGNQLIAKGRFAPADANPFAQQVRKLYDAKIVRTTSVGFIAREMQGNVITKAELLEFSFVPVPANPYALSLRDISTLGLDTSMLKAKGISFKAEGDVCTLEDGTEGMMAQNADGALVCMPKPEDKSKGAVQDELTADQKWEMKWENLDKVCETIDALFNVYLDEATPVENFSTLLAETIAILGQIAPQTDATKIADVVKTMISGKTAKRFTARRKTASEEVGAALTQMQSTIDNTIVEASKTVLASIGSDGTAKAVKGSETHTETSRVFVEKTINGMKAAIVALEDSLKGIEGEENSGGESLKERSNVVGSDELVKSIEDFSTSRQVLRMINNITSDSLRKFNAKSRSHK